MRIENFPIKLLKEIKEYSLNDQEHCYSISIILNALKTLLLMKAKGNRKILKTALRDIERQEIL
jgi:hypothetical protein